MGVFRPRDAERGGEGWWFLDANGTSTWDGCATDSCHVFGLASDRPVVGSWADDDRDRIGVFRPAPVGWFLDRNGNGQWDGCDVDHCIDGFGLADDQPVAGDWTGSGITTVGVFRDGAWYLDANGNGQWDDCALDRCGQFGQASDRPVVGDWVGDGVTRIGVFRDGSWYFDRNGNQAWDGCEIDGCAENAFGAPGDMPVAGDWVGDGVTRIGVYRDGSWYFDLHGNQAWDGCTIDQCVEKNPAQPETGFGLPGNVPVTGRW